MLMSEVAKVHFNHIENNTFFGIYLLEIGVDARNNWWGSSNEPTVSYQQNNDIFSTFASLNMIGLTVNNAHISNKTKNNSTTIYGSDYTHAKNENNLTVKEAKIILQTHPNAFKLNALESLQEALKDKNQRAGLLIVGGFALVTVGFVRPGADFIVDGVLMCFDAESPPPDEVSYYRICP